MLGYRLTFSLAAACGFGNLARESEGQMLEMLALGNLARERGADAGDVGEPG